MRGSRKAPSAIPPAPRARYWDGVARECQQTRPEFLFRIHADQVNSRLFAGWLPEGRAGRVLKTDLFDEAFGSGLYPLLGSRAQSVTGIDVSRTVVLAARERYGELRAAAADVRDLPFADRTFDVIVSDSTLDHFESAAEIISSLRELHRVLRPGGELLLTLDNPANPVVALRKLLPFKIWNRLGLLRYYVGATLGVRRLRRLLPRLGFRVHEMRAVMHCPRTFAMPAARLLDKYAGPRTQRCFLLWLISFERLARWPTRFLTGHFVAAKATKC